MSGRATHAIDRPEPEKYESITSDLTDLEGLKASTTKVMEAAGIAWKVEPVWLATPDDRSPGNQLRIFSGLMASADKSEQIDAISELIFWLQARRLAQDWHKD